MRYALFGDSHAQVVFPILESILRDSGHDVVISKPVAGWTLQKHLENGFKSILTGSDADALVLSLGGNNSNLSPSYQQTIDQALQIAKQAGIKKIYWVSPAWAIRDDVQIRHEWTTNYLKSNLPRHVKFIDIRPLTKSGHRSDGVHFSRNTYEQWAKLVSDRLLTQLAIIQIPKWTWWIGGGVIGLSMLTLIWKRLK
jgi:hypothetical protein